MTSLVARDRPGVALAGICVSALLFGVEISSVPTILPIIGTELGGSFTSLQWIMNAYTIAVATVLLPVGALADRYGHQRLLVAACAVFGLSSLMCGLAPTVPALVAGRALQGLSGGAMLICQIAMLSRTFPAGRSRGRAFGVWGVVFGAGLGFGPAVGALTVVAATWRWVFLAPAALSVLALALVRLGGSGGERGTGAGRLDVAGILTSSAAVLALVTVVTQGAELAPLVTVGLLGAAALLAAVFVLVERRAAAPVLPLGLLRHRWFSGALLGSIGMNVSFWPLIVYLPLHLERGLGLDIVTAGLALLAFTVPTLLLPPLAERLGLWLHPGVLVPGGLAVIGLGLLGIWVGTAAADGAALVPGMLVAGIGLGLTNTPVTNTTTGSVTAELAGVASGVDMAARMITLAIGIAALGRVLTIGVSHAASAASDPTAAETTRRIVDGTVPDPAAFTAGFAAATLTGAVAVLVTAAASLAVFRPRSLRRVERAVSP